MKARSLLGISKAHNNLPVLLSFVIRSTSNKENLLNWKEFRILEPVYPKAKPSILYQGDIGRIITLLIKDVIWGRAGWGLPPL